MPNLVPTLPPFSMTSSDLFASCKMPGGRCDVIRPCSLHSCLQECNLSSVKAIKWIKWRWDLSFRVRKRSASEEKQYETVEEYMLFLNDQVLTTPPLNMIPNRQPDNPLFVYGKKIFPWDQHGSSLPSWFSRVQFPWMGKHPPSNYRKGRHKHDWNRNGWNLRFPR